MKKEGKIFIAGHSGLVGSAIVRKLKVSGHTNLLFRSHSELDLRRQTDVEQMFERERPEYVFLCAAKVGGILANSTYKADFLYDNLAIAQNIIYASYKFGVKKLLNLGSSCIYPKFAKQPISEDSLLDGKLEATNEPYAIAKITAIKLCRYYNEQHGTNFISAMPSNLYGPGDNYDLEIAHVLPAMVRKFHLAKLLRSKAFDEIGKDVLRYPLGFGISVPKQATGDWIKKTLANIGVTEDEVVIWGTGSPYREFLFSDDLADAMLFLMERYNYQDLGELVNVGPGVDQTIKELAETIRTTVGFDGKIRYDASKPDGMSRKLLDITKMKNFGWSAKTSLLEGLNTTYRSYCSSLSTQASHK